MFETNALSPNWRPHDGQRQFLENASRFKVLACGRRWGKTDACAAQIALSLLGHSPTRHIILAPTQDQANLLFRRTLELLDGLGICPETRWSPYPTARWERHRIAARSGHLARALRGNEATHLIVDEASFLPESLITEVAMPMLATTNGFITLIGTPNGRNHFWRFFQMGQDGRHGIWSRTAPSCESPFVSKDFLALQKGLIADRAYRVEYEAEFMDSAGQLFSTDSIYGCVVEDLPPLGDRTYIGVDWGRSQDYTAIAVLRGTFERAGLLECERYTALSWNRLAEKVADVVRRYPRSQILTDATGVGSALLQDLRELLPGDAVGGLVFTNPIKSELAYGLAAMLEHRRILMKPNPELLRELQYYEVKESPSGKAVFGAPQGLHDDMVTALMLAAGQIGQPASSRVLRGQERTFRFDLQGTHYAQTVFSKDTAAPTRAAANAA